MHKEQINLALNNHGASHQNKHIESLDTLPNATILGSIEDLNDRENELSKYSYHLLIWKLKLLEDETTLSQVTSASSNLFNFQTNQSCSNTET